MKNYLRAKELEKLIEEAEKDYKKFESMKDTNLVAVVMTKVSIADGGYQNHFVCEAPNYDANKVYKDVLKYKKKVLDDYNKEFLDLVGRMEEDEVATGS